MKYEKENRFFKLTRSALQSYKKSDPLEKARNPRQSFFAGQWDVSWAFGEWILTVIFMICAFVIDIILLPFQALSLLTTNDKTKFKTK
jgi:hypothetical protein